MSLSADPLSVVIPVHNATGRLDRLTAWRQFLDKCGRAYELLVVDDGSTDDTARLVGQREPRVQVLRHEHRRGYGACLRTAVAQARYPLLFYTALDYPYTPTDLNRLLERINLRDEVSGKQPDLVSGCRTGHVAPGWLRWGTWAWRGFWRVFAGLPVTEPTPWHGWPAFWYGLRASWVYGVPLADVNSCFKLYRTAFLRRFPIQSDGDFVHVELAAKATFLSCVLDEVPLTPQSAPVPLIGDTRADRRRVFRNPQFIQQQEGSTAGDPSALAPPSDSAGAAAPSVPLT